MSRSRTAAWEEADPGLRSPSSSGRHEPYLLLLAGKHIRAPAGDTCLTIPDLIGDDNYVPETPKPPSVLANVQQRQPFR